MIHTVTVTANEVPDGLITSFSFNVAGSTQPLRRGGFRAIDTAPLPINSQLIQDNGLGGTLAGSNGTITSTLNYTTTLATPQTVTFTLAPAVGNVVTLQLDVHQGFPVMGIMNFFTQTNNRQLVVADTTYVNRFNSATNRLDDISPAVPLTGDKTKFFSWTNYPGADGLQRLLFVNNKDKIQQYSGANVTPFEVYASSSIITNENKGLGTGVSNYLLNTTSFPVVRGTLRIVAGAQNVRDDGFGNLIGDVNPGGNNTINYVTGAIDVTFLAVVPNTDTIFFSYSAQTQPIQTALHLFQFKDRLVILAPTMQDGVPRGRRIMISGTGILSDVFSSEAIGAGFIDIPDETSISSADFNRDDLIIFTQDST